MMADVIAEPVLSARNFSKTFGDRTVLRGVAMDIQPGEVRGLLGQNGSGKSTFIKILAGYHAPDSGASLAVCGKPVGLPLTPGDPRRLGISFVHQDLGLVESLTILETLRLGRYQTRMGWRIPWREEGRYVRQALAGFGLDLSPETKIGTLQDVDRAMIAILRALEELQVRSSGLLVLDEPSAYLPRDGVDRLFNAIRQVADRGFGVLYVSHRLEEVRAITDTVSILRDGELVSTGRTSQIDEQTLIERILGFSLGELYPEPHRPTSEILASVRGLEGGKVRNFSLDVQAGEIVGLTGLLGMGYEEVPYMLFGAEPARAGELSLAGARIAIPRLNPRNAIRLGMALLPGNRPRDGGIAAASVAENVSLTTIGAFFRAGLLRRGAETSRVQDLLDTFQVRPAETARGFGTLSGGNQQKALVAKWFETQPRLLLLHEPTQGVDVGAKRDIFEQIRNAAVQRGVGAIIASAEYEDLAHLCDRVLVFRDGQVVSELHGAMLTAGRIVEQCFRERAPVEAAPQSSVIGV